MTPQLCKNNSYTNKRGDLLDAKILLTQIPHSSALLLEHFVVVYASKIRLLLKTMQLIQVRVNLHVLSSRSNFQLCLKYNDLIVILSSCCVVPWLYSKQNPRFTRQASLREISGRFILISHRECKMAFVFK